MVIAAEGRFFKVLLPGFHRKLNLPRAFCEKLEEEDEPEGAILEIRKGEWKIGTRRDGEGVISFEDGWPEFARRHSLSVGDFVVFEHTGRLRFNVLVFGPNACEKELPIAGEKELPIAGEKELPIAGETELPIAGEKELPIAGETELPIAGETELPIAGETELPIAGETELPIAGEKELPNAGEKELPVGSGSERGAIEAEKPNCLKRRIRRKPEKNSGVSYHSKDPYFVVTITPFLTNYKGELSILKEFVASNDLGKKTWARLRNPAGEVWVGKLFVHHDPFRCRMRTGWREFCVSNELKDGDVCVFVLDRSVRTSPMIVSFDVKIFRSSASN